MKYTDVVKAMRKQSGQADQLGFYANGGPILNNVRRFGGLGLTEQERNRRMAAGSTPWGFFGLIGGPNRKAETQIADTAEAYKRFLDARKAKGLPLPDHVSEVNGKYQVNVPER